MSAKFESVVGSGTAEFVNTDQEKVKALECILRQYGVSFSEFNESSLSSVVISGKE